jgi:hypothetical protein
MSLFRAAFALGSLRKSSTYHCALLFFLVSGFLGVTTICKGTVIGKQTTGLGQQWL